MPSDGAESAFDHVETFQIGDHPTDIVYHSFANKSFLLITQRQKVTNVYTVRNQAANDLNGGTGTGSRIYSIKHTFGAASDEVEAAIRYLMNFIDKNDEIVITLGLKEINKPTLDLIGAQLRRIV
uniref:Putative proteasome complex n=1 Tax=Culex tarsalis TaxID=7177 RepID=A0A1Q3FYA9_CULTA